MERLMVFVISCILLIGGVSSLECFACSGSMKPENCNIAKCEKESEKCFLMIPNSSNKESVIRGCLPPSPLPDFVTDCESNEACEYLTCTAERCNHGEAAMSSIFLILLSVLSLFWFY
ncbi:hypothetical protein ACHWQZ_G008357 [Mnemiopsis leidyi]